MKTYRFEQTYWNKSLTVCGVDEVGRGCLAGPVVTCAAILAENKMCPTIKDSKLLSPAQIAKSYLWLIDNATFAISIESNRIIDRHNIYQATARSMKKSLLHLFTMPQIAIKLPSLILVDAMPITLVNSPYSNIEIQSFCKGESISASIAAASIIAKYTRDQIVRRLDLSFPGYHLAQHKGYGTAKHQAAILQYSPSIIHRASFLKNLYPEPICPQPQGLHEQQSILC